MLLSDLLSSLPVHVGHQVNTVVPFFHTVRGWLLSNHLDRGLPHRRYADGFTKLLAVARDNSDLAPAAARRNIEQFLFHGVRRDDHGVYGFALASMGGDRISVGEFVIVRRKCSSVFEAYGTTIQGSHFDQLSVGRPEFRPSTVCCQYEAVARGNLNGLTLINGKCPRLFRRDAHLFTGFFSRNQ